MVRSSLKSGEREGGFGASRNGKHTFPRYFGVRSSLAKELHAAHCSSTSTTLSKCLGLTCQNGSSTISSRLAYCISRRYEAYVELAGRVATLIRDKVLHTDITRLV